MSLAPPAPPAAQAAPLAPPAHPVPLAPLAAQAAPLVSLAPPAPLAAQAFQAHLALLVCAIFAVLSEDALVTMLFDWHAVMLAADTWSTTATNTFVTVAVCALHCFHSYRHWLRSCF